MSNILRNPENGRYDTDQPWICWWFLTTDRHTRITGRSKVLIECCVCGKTEKLTIRLPRIGPVPNRGQHPERIRFKLAHLHPDKPALFAWAKPMRNPFANGGIDLDALAMRLEADLRDAEAAS